MKASACLAVLSLLAPAIAAADSDDALDRFGDALTFSNAAGTFRGKVSGTFDVAGYWFEAPAPALLHTDDNSLVSPRLELFLDAQAGSRWYFFAQARLDRGFDPGDGGMEARLDEYAVRVALRADGALNLQAGKFATVVGNWVPRHHPWENPFLSAPLPYENVTGMFDAVAANSAAILLRWANLGPNASIGDSYLAGLRLPVIWGPSYATGAAISGTAGHFDYAIEMKNASLSSRPDYWTTAETGWDAPTVSTRLGFRPGLPWNLGFSASTGSYLSPEAAESLPPGTSLGDYRQITFGSDVSYSWHHLQLWAEFFATRFEIPHVGPADTFAYYVEARYKFSPQFSGAVRWNQQTYGTVADASGEQKWGRDTWRIDLATTYRFTAHLLMKLQYSVQQHPLDGRDYAHTVGAQLVLRF